MSCVLPLLAHPSPFLPAPFAVLVFPKLLSVYLSSNELPSAEMGFGFALCRDKWYFFHLPPVNLPDQQWGLLLRC